MILDFNGAVWGIKSDETPGDIVISRADLPECSIVERNGMPHVDCGSDWGTWNVKHLDRMRQTALEYVAAWQAAEAWHSKSATDDRRRDGLARELVGDGAYAYRFADEPLKLAIDRIIALEGTNA